MPFGKVDKHESYGMIGMCHSTCSQPKPLFGSSIKHGHTIKIRISRAVVERDLHQEWYHARDRGAVEIEMSASQFAQFITTPNIGDGVPCTIKRIDGKMMADPPYNGHNEVFNQELSDDVKKAMSDADELIDSARETLSQKRPIKASEKKDLLAKINSLVQHIKSNMPLIHKQFARSMDKTVAAAKAEVEEFYTSTIIKMGKAALDACVRPEIESLHGEDVNTHIESVDLNEIETHSEPINRCNVFYGSCSEPYAEEE